MAMPGSSQSVQRLVDDHYVALYRYAFRLSGSAADAEDLTQEAFCKAQLHLAQLRDPERVKPWLFKILRNEYLHGVRADRQANAVSLDVIGDVAQRGPEVWPAVDPERLQAALAELPESFRTAVILYYFEDFSYRDIAEQMDVPVGTVMSRLSRAKAFLRGRLLPAEPAAVPGGVNGEVTDGLHHGADVGVLRPAGRPGAGPGGRPRAG